MGKTTSTKRANVDFTPKQQEIYDSLTAGQKAHVTRTFKENSSWNTSKRTRWLKTYATG